MTNEEYLALESYMMRSCEDIGLVLLDEPLFKAYIKETQIRREELSVSLNDVLTAPKTGKERARAETEAIALLNKLGLLK